MSQQYTRDELIARLTRAGELEVSGDDSVEGLESYFDTESFTFDGPGGWSTDYNGLMDYFAAVRAAFEDRTIRRGIMLVEDNVLACQTWIEGTFTSTFTHAPGGPMEPNGKRIVWDLINIFRFDDQGQLVAESVRTDFMDLHRQLSGSEG